MWRCYFPRSCCSLLILGFAKPNGEPTDYWLLFSFFLLLSLLTNLKSSPRLPFPHPTALVSSLPPVVPLEAEEVKQSFALDFLQNQQNQPNDPQTEVPTPNLTNHLGPASGRESPPGIPRLVPAYLAHAQGKELQELLPLVAEAELGDSTESMEHFWHT